MEWTTCCQLQSCLVDGRLTQCPWGKESNFPLVSITCVQNSESTFWLVGPRRGVWTCKAPVYKKEPLLIHDRITTSIAHLSIEIYNYCNMVTHNVAHIISLNNAHTFHPLPKNTNPAHCVCYACSNTTSYHGYHHTLMFYNNYAYSVLRICSLQWSSNALEVMWGCNWKTTLPGMKINKGTLKQYSSKVLCYLRVTNFSLLAMRIQEKREF